MDTDYDLTALIEAQSENVRVYDDRTTDGDSLTSVAPVGASAAAATASGIFGGYIVPPTAWQLYPTPQMRARWVTLRIPPSVDIGPPWLKFTPVRLAYVDELGQSARGVRGPFSVTHWGKAGYGIQWTVAKPMDPALYNYFNTSLGQSESRFAVLARNVFWVAAVIGGFDPVGSSMGEQYQGPHFYVHYNDGDRYSAVIVPWDAVIDYVRKGAPRELLEAEYGADSPELLDATAGAVGLLEPLTADASDGTTAAFAPVAPGAAVGTSAPVFVSSADKAQEPLINPSFYGVNMARFWPQFFFALDVALPFASSVGSSVLLNSLRRMDHWPLLKAHMEHNQGAFSYLPPAYKIYTGVGNLKRPSYQA